MSKKHMAKKVLPVFAVVCVCTLILAFSVNQVKDNTLTPAEKEGGWILLFDGKTTKGWRSYNRQPQDSWEVVAGQLHCKNKGVKNRADLITVDQYENYELRFDWKIDKGANSGLVYRVIETSKPSHETGLEYQLIDDEGSTEKLLDWQKSGADYGMHPPLVVASRLAGEWNQSKIIVNGPQVQHWLNARKVADFELWTPEWTALKEKSKWKDLVNYGMAKTGFIALQDHGGGIWFKNIKLRKL